MKRAFGLVDAGTCICLCACMMMAGCGGPASVVTRYPPDFALVFTVEPGRYASPDDPLRRPAQYVLESDRTLRVALGPGVHHGLYPPATATLPPMEIAGLYRVVEAYGLLNAPTRLDSANEPTYRVELTANGQVHRYATTPDASPGSVSLLRRLIAMHQNHP